MKKVSQLMLYFHSLRSPWRQVDIFRYIPSSRKTVVLFVNKNNQGKGKQKYKSFFMKYLQTTFLNAVWTLQSDVVSLQSETIEK